MTHFIPFDSPRLPHNQRRAWCGQVVDPRSHAALPGCGPCRHHLTEDEASFAATAGDALPLDEPDFGPPASGFVPPCEIVDEAVVDLDALQTGRPLFDPPPAQAAQSEVLPFVPGVRPARPAPLDTPPVTRELVNAEPDQVLVQTSLQRAASTLSIVEESGRIIPRAEALVVTDAASCELGEDLFDILRSFETAIHEHYDPHCDRAHKVWKGLTDERAMHLKPIETTRKALGDRIAVWRADMKRQEQLEQRRLEEQARDDVRNNAAREAARAERAGDVDTAKAILKEAETAPLPVVAAPRSALPSTGKTTTREPWKAYIVDWPALRAQIGRGECPEFDELLQQALQAVLNRQATTLKGELGKRYLGTEGRQKPTLAGR